ncbi:MAG: hypothetical protein Aurels2KO_23540 [Aureliella sp.]
MAKQPVDDYFIEPGDRILVEPIKLDSEFQSAGDQVVMVDGSIDLGKFGRLRVAGLTVEDIEQAVMQRIEAVSNTKEQINVQLLETNGSHIYVLGAVGSPGTYPLTGNETVLDAILLAGGLTSSASACDIIFVRPTDECQCRVVQRICYRQITQLGDVTTNFQLQPGDRIVVGERTFHQELAFWKQAEPCPCCDRSNCVEKCPEAVSYRNRFLSWLPPPPTPLGQTGQTKADADLPSETRAVEPGATSPLPSVPSTTSSPSDANFFLPEHATTPPVSRAEGLELP